MSLRSTPAKVAVASAAALAAAASIAGVAGPQVLSVAGAFFPRAWAAARVWLVPPYLFVTVHLIILVIWKLSGHSQKHSQEAPAPHKDPWHHHQPSHYQAPVAVEVPAVASHKEEFVAAVQHVERLEPEGSPDSGGGESCVTTESDDGAAAYLPDVRLSLAPAGKHAVLERELSPPPPAATATAVDCGVENNDDDDDDDDDMDATWKAIMQKKRPATAPATAPAVSPALTPPPPRARDPSVGAEEMNKRFDDFIKKNRHSFRRP